MDKETKKAIFWTIVLCGLIAIFTLNIKFPAGSVITTSASRPYESTGEFHIIEPPVPMAPKYTEDSLEYQSFTQINDIRSDNGLRVLSYSANLSDDAIVRAEECDTKFSHTRPNNTDWYTVDPDLMYGENLAKDFYNANDLITAWMNSPTHRELILTADYNTCGIGTYTAEDGITYVALEFGY